MKIIRRKLKYYVNCLENNIPVTLSRWGDGEIRTVLLGKYKGGKNSNGCTHTPYLSKFLVEVLTNHKDHDYGILRIGLRPHKREFDNWLKANRVSFDWVDGDLMLNENLAGRFLPMLEQIRKRRVLLVGPTHIRGLDKIGFFDYVSFVQPPAKNAIQERSRIIREIKRAIDTRDIGLILWSSGIHAKVFINDIFDYTNGELSQIDCGSMWDGYFQDKSKGSRSYIRRGRVDFPALIDVYTGKRDIKKGESFRLWKI